MNPTLPDRKTSLASIYVAPQHRPRPLAGLLEILREEAADDPALTAAVLAGIRIYQSALRPSLPLPPPVVGRAGRAALIDLGGDGPPLVLVPSLINGSKILDLDAERSLARWLAGRGWRVLLVDWGVPAVAERNLSVAGHVEMLLAPLLRGLEEPPLVVGYCLGGTMALAVAALVPLRALALIATPWRFGGYGAQRQLMEELWRQAGPAAERLGFLPMEVLQLGFWRLDPARTLAKFAAFAAMDNEEHRQAFVRVEDWANSGPPLTHAAARELAEDMFARDVTGRGRWLVGGTPVRAMPGVPLLEIVSTSDRIVPAATTPGLGERHALALGHVGMIVGRGARRKVWEPLAQWLRRQ